MLTKARTRVAGGRGDAGASLAELMVAMAVTTTVATIALSLFVWTGRATRDAAENSFTTDAVRLAVSAMASTLRVADSPTSQPGAADFRIVDPLSRTGISLFANVNGNRSGSAARALPTRVVYTFSGGTVTETQYQPLPGAVAKPTTWIPNYPTSPTTTRTLLRGAASLRFDYDLLDPRTGLLTPVADKDLGGTPSASLATVTVTVTTVATAGRPAQTVTSTAVLTGSTS